MTAAGSSCAPFAILNSVWHMHKWNCDHNVAPTLEVCCCSQCIIPSVSCTWHIITSQPLVEHSLPWNVHKKKSWLQCYSNSWGALSVPMNCLVCPLHMTCCYIPTASGAQLTPHTPISIMTIARQQNQPWELAWNISKHKQWSPDLLHTLLNDIAVNMLVEGFQWKWHLWCSISCFAGLSFFVGFVMPGKVCQKRILKRNGNQCCFKPKWDWSDGDSCVSCSIGPSFGQNDHLLNGMPCWRVSTVPHSTIFALMCHFNDTWSKRHESFCAQSSFIFQ